MSPRLSDPETIIRDGVIRPNPAEDGRTDAFLPSPCIQNHAANLALLRDGDLACTWFGGTQEGVPDISPYMARLAPGATRWSAPVRLSDDTTRSEQNPILAYGPDGHLWLLFTSQVSGNQDTALVRCRVSLDHGRSWGPTRTLIDEPGTFVRQPPIVRPNGDWLLPVFLCRTEPGVKWTGDHDVSEVRISSDGGATWNRHPVPGSLGCVHMCIVEGPNGLVAFFRSRWADRIHVSRSADGRSWSEPEPTELPNNNSSIQAIRLRDGRLAVAFNASSAADATDRRLSLYDDLEDDGTGVAAPVAAGRTAFWGAPRAPMTIALSDDDGRTWPRQRDADTGDGYCMTNNSKDGLNRELSYPSLVQRPDGTIVLAFTYHRKAIKVCELSPEWLVCR